MDFSTGFLLEHIDRAKGDCDPSTATVWRGDMHFLGVLYLYEQVVVAFALGYDVIEVRSQLVTPEP